MSVDWAGLEHAYGSAGDTPGTVHRLATGDLREAATALGTLHSTIAHQASVYSATLAVVPLLARIAGDPATSVRAGTVLLLDTIASAPFGKKDEEYAFSIRRKVRRHLAGTRSRIASVDLLGEFCEQLSPIYFRPWWYEFGY